MVRVADTVRQALDEGRAVVALESTAITHGLPRPDNLALAHRLEEAVRAEGAVPATVGVVAGEVVVGLSDAELARLAAGPADKASLWNIAGLLARGADAGTTVATTLHVAARCGIDVFATGGLGGVHDTPFDESADLVALARTSAITVCSGPKSLLDASATLERLETGGVTVVGWRSDRLAGFLTPLTDLAVPLRADDADAVAATLDAARALGLVGAVVVSQPVEDGVDRAELEVWLEEAHAHAQRAGVRGRDVTPFLLERLGHVSGGVTVSVNLRLLEANARLGGRIAGALAARRSAARGAATSGGRP